MKSTIIQKGRLLSSMSEINTITKRCCRTNFPLSSRFPAERGVNGKPNVSFGSRADPSASSRPVLHCGKIGGRKSGERTLEIGDEIMFDTTSCALHSGPVATRGVPRELSARSQGRCEGGIFTAVARETVAPCSRC